MHKVCLTEEILLLRSFNHKRHQIYNIHCPNNNKKCQKYYPVRETKPIFLKIKVLI